jgi:hypothetical protein
MPNKTEPNGILQLLINADDVNLLWYNMYDKEKHRSLSSP